MNLFDTLSIPTSKLDLFVRSVEIGSYMPGRIRLYSKKMIGNTALEREVEERLTAFAEIDSVKTSAVSGSILITYEPERLRQNAGLRKVEEYIMRHAKK